MIGSIRKHLAILYLVAAVVVLGGFLGVATYRSQANAAVPNEAPQANSYQRIAYVAGGSKTMAGSGTVVAGEWKCGLGANSIYGAEVQFTGDVVGTNHTLDITWQNSWDRGTTTANVGTFPQINASAAAGTERQTVADIVGSTAVAFGECFRVNYALGGSGTVTANFKVNGIAK